MGDQNSSWYSRIAPGVLLAATTVGAGDVLTTSMAGSEVGLAVLWAVPAGVALKWTLAEGIARWQMATGTTLLEGWTRRLGGWIQWVFIPYLILFSFSTSAALVSACGVAGAGMLPIGDLETSKKLWGVAHSMAGLGLVWFGSFQLFERLMGVCIGLMFGSVVLTAALIGPDWSAVARGLLPSIPPGGMAWTLGVLGGIGGTVTLLFYGYWIREKGRSGRDGLKACWFDLALSHAVIALFGMGIVIVGSRVELRGQGTDLALVLAEQLAGPLGPLGRWVFLIGFWGAVFSSVLGVWHSMPYLFVDFLRLRRGEEAVDLSHSRTYRAYQLCIATIPLTALWIPVKQVQLAFGVLAAMFLPLLSLTLLILNNRRSLVGGFRSGLLINAVLGIGLLFFAYVGVQEIVDRLSAMEASTAAATSSSGASWPVAAVS